MLTLKYVALYFRFNIDRIGIHQGLKWAAWYHTAISWPMHRLLAIFVTGVACAWLVLAGLLMAINHDCGLDLDSYGEAMMLAIITISTIGCVSPRVGVECGMSWGESLSR